MELVGDSGVGEAIKGKPKREPTKAVFDWSRSLELHGEAVQNAEGRRPGGCSYLPAK